MKSKDKSQNKAASMEDSIYSYIIRDYNFSGSLASAKGQIMPADIKSSILYESSFDECKWEECDMSTVSGNGSHFLTCDFLACKIDNAAFQHSIFDSDIFYKSILSGSNFAYSNFEWTIIKDSDIDGCAFTGTSFSNVTFQDCTIKHSNFELCKFQKVLLKNVDMSNLTLKYVFFRNVKMKNVKLPFMQLPYTFGGLACVLSHRDGIKLVTTNPLKQLMTIKEYKKIIPKLIEFFKKHDDYFPLANCYLSNNQIELAKAANKTGIINSTTLCDFRKLYFYCLQAAQEIKLSKSERGEIYNEISRNIPFKSLASAEYHEFKHYFPMIKQLMFDNPFNNPTLAISFHTNIEASDFKNLGLFMKSLDLIAESCGAELDSKHLEIRHNSPNIVDWFPIGELNNLIVVLKNSLDFLEPIFSDTMPKLLQNTANAAAIIGFLHSYNNKRKDDAKNKNKSKATELVKSESERVTSIDISMAYSEIKALRKELTSQKKQCQKKHLSSRNNNISNEIKECNPALETIKSAIKNSEIKIDMLDIHFLGDQSDVWEYLYNNDGEIQ